MRADNKGFDESTYLPEMLRQDACWVLLNGLCCLPCFQDDALHFNSLSLFPLENLAQSKV